MFKKAKRANFRRRNDSDEDEPEQGPQPSGPVVEIPFMETSGGSSDHGLWNSTGNGFLAAGNSLRAAKKDKKVKDVAVAVAPTSTKASLLSFDDEEGEQMSWCFPAGAETPLLDCVCLYDAARFITDSSLVCFFL